jgi:hypothetical protein
MPEWHYAMSRSPPGTLIPARRAGMTESARILPGTLTTFSLPTGLRHLKPLISRAQAV